MLTNSNYLTTRQAADKLGVSVPTVQQWVERGLLQSWKTEGGHRRISRASVLELLESQRRAGEESRIPYALPVLVVEDDAFQIACYRATLATWSFPVTIYVAPNGFEGLVLAGEVQPRLLICDLRLPGVNGFNVVRALCDMPRFSNVGIVVVSGMPLPEIEAHGGLPKRVEIMAKPADFARLERIAEALYRAEHSETKGPKLFTAG